MRTLAALALVAASLLLASTACGGAGGDVAADFTVPLYSGGEHLGGAEEVSLSDLEGRAVIVNFWAPLCPPCRAEMPHFQEVWDQIQADGSDAVVLGVDVGPFTMLGDRDQAVEFLRTVDLTYPTGQAQDAAILHDYAVLGMPTTIFITPDGQIHRKWSGAITKSQLQEVTAELVQ